MQVTQEPWNGDDPPTVIDAVGIPSQRVVLRRMDLGDLLELAAAHIEDMRGDVELAAELRERSVR